MVFVLPLYLERYDICCLVDKMTTLQFKNVYVASRGTSVGPLEMQGPLGKYFDCTHDEDHCGCDSFEKAERLLIREACDQALRKANLNCDDIGIMVGGDLMNQLTSSNYFAKDITIPFLGMYGACSNSSLVIGQAAIWVENKYVNRAMAFTSSHIATAERQFRYPNEYGVQKKETTTMTVTGAGAILLTNEPNTIKVTAFTPGKVIDWGHKDANDMGLAMTPAAYDTLTTHFCDMKRTFDDYDLVVTGDLSKIGYSFLMDLLNQDQINTQHKLQDCGLMIFDILKQDVFCGGSGCGCSMCVSMTKLLTMIEQGECRRILVIATGALLSPVAIQQKGTIPCIAHAIVYERSE